MEIVGFYLRSWYNGSMSQTKSTKVVTCPDCGQSRQIRSDSPSLRCRHCACKLASGGSAPRPNRIKGRTKNCLTCGREFWSVPSDNDRHFCSPLCGNSARRTKDKREKMRARWTANNAVRDGKMDRLPCEQCGHPESQMHHHDYTKPLEVHHLCRKCHDSLHIAHGDFKAHVDHHTQADI